LWRRIATDRVYSHNYPRDLHQKLAISFIVDLMTSKSEGFADNQCRGANFAFKQLYNPSNLHKLAESKKLHPGKIKKVLSDIYEEIQFGENRDLVDTDLVQFATVGNFWRGWMTSVLCLTTASESQVCKRVS